MEFKYDEAWMHEYVARHVAGGEFATQGIRASFDFVSPPLNLYLLSLPVMLSQEPMACAAFVAALNGLAAGAAYHIGRELAGRATGVFAALLFATSPWAVIFSRKIWAQDLLPPFACIALAALVRLERRRERRDAVVAAASLVLLPQIHLSALPLLALLPVQMWRHRTRGLGPWLAGIGIGIVPLLPYGAFQAATGFRDVRSVAAIPTQQPAHVRWDARRLAGFHSYAALAGAEDFHYLLDRRVRREGRIQWEGDAADFRKEAPSRALLRWIEWIALGLGIVACCGRKGLLRHGWPLLAWAGLPPLAAALLPRSSVIHYFVVTYPTQFVFMALGFREVALLARRIVPGLRLVAAAMLIVVVVANVRYVEAFNRFISRTTGTRGDYGIAYEYKRRVVDHIAERFGGRALYFEDFSLPDSFVAAKVPEPLRYTYEYLLRRRGVHVVPLGDAEVFCALFNDRLPGSKMTISPVMRPVDRLQFGPLVLWGFERTKP